MRLHSPSKAAAPAPAAAPAAGKTEDLYEMAIQHKKDEDFSGWYTDVSQLRCLLYRVVADIRRS